MQYEFWSKQREKNISWQGTGLSSSSTVRHSHYVFRQMAQILTIKGTEVLCSCWFRGYTMKGWKLEDLSGAGHSAIWRKWKRNKILLFQASTLVSFPFQEMCTVREIQNYWHQVISLSKDGEAWQGKRIMRGRAEETWPTVQFCLEMKRQIMKTFLTFTFGRWCGSCPFRLCFRPELWAISTTPWKFTPPVMGIVLSS